MAIVQCYNCGKCEPSIDYMNIMADGSLLCAECFKQRTMGSLSNNVICPNCQGKGLDSDGFLCSECFGAGTIEEYP